MMRIFGLIVALAAFVAPAQAALLTYGLNNTAVGVVSPGGAGTAADFSGSGQVGATFWSTSAVSNGRSNTFSFTAAKSVSFDFLSVAARRGSNQPGKDATIQVFYNIGATDLGTAGTSLGAPITLGPSNGPFSTYTLAAGAGVLAPGQKIHFTIRSMPVNSYSGTIQFDSVVLGGSVVPEPTSMAVFGLLGAGIAARRIRRKA